MCSFGLSAIKGINQFLRKTHYIIWESKLPLKTSYIYIYMVVHCETKRNKIEKNEI